MHNTTARQESANWLTVYPTHDKIEKKYLSEFEKSLGNFVDTQEIVLAIGEALETGVWQGKKISLQQHKLLERVLEFISRGVSFGVDEAVSLRNRRVTDAERKRYARESAENDKKVEIWSYYSGDYRGLLVGDTIKGRASHPFKGAYTGDINEMISERYKPSERVGDTVHFLSERIIQLLEMKRDKPVVLVDIGAMYGSTLLELAIKHQKAIREGRLVLIATNIGLNIDVIKNTPRPRNGIGMYNNYDELLREAEDLVHYLVTDVEGLLETDLMLPNGTKYSVKENSVDIIHENWSVSYHSRSLEHDISIMARLIGQNGMILSHRHDPLRGSGGLSDTGMNSHNHTYTAVAALSKYSQMKGISDEEFERLQGFQLLDIDQNIIQQTNKTLLNFGLKRVESIRDPKTNDEHELNYSLWLGKSCEPVTIYTQGGESITISPKDALRKTSLGHRFFTVIRGLLGIGNV